jgi:hypothetical protein
VHRSTVDLLAIRLTADKKFWSPLTVLSLMVGGVRYGGIPRWASS